MDEKLPDVKSGVANVCPDSINSRLGCCQPTDVRHLNNVKIQKGKFLLFTGQNGHKKKTSIPNIVSVHTRQRITFSAEIEEVSEDFKPSVCKEYFNGTLHVIGRVTAHNVYHTMGDNFAPLAYQILLDSFLRPDLLHAPRVGLHGHPGHPENDMSTPHVRMINDLMSAGLHSMGDLDGVCFQRVVWGHGAHVFYLDSLVAMRRMVASFSRQFALNMYKIDFPSEYEREDRSHGLTVSNSSQTDLAGLRVVIFSRGSSGKGRSMQGEGELIAALKVAGAKAALCCDFSKTSLEQQIAYAVYADVIGGVHGAALVHGMFMPVGGIILELKTLYGFTSGLFQLVADSREGLVAQVDVRDYWIPGGHKPIDAGLIARSILMLKEALKLRSEGSAGRYRCIKAGPKHDKVDCAVGSILVNSSDVIGQSLAHVLGPKLDEMEHVCHSTVLHEFRVLELDKGDNELHCAFCREFT